MIAARLDRRVQFRRSALSDDGFTSGAEAWADHGGTISAQRNDISDGERWRAGEVGASITARFTVRSSGFTRAITPKDRLICDGREYDIVGIKEIGRNRFLEITAAARADR